MIYTFFIQQLFFGILALLFTYFVGKFIISFFEIKENFFFKLFVTYIIGITAIVLCYSIIKAHGRTVNILLLPVIGYLFYYFRNSFKVKPEIDTKTIMQDLFWSLIPFLLVFLYQSWFYFDLNTNELKTLFFDTYCYGLISDNLKLIGKENGYLELNYFTTGLNGLVPYHFQELWLNAFFSKHFTLSTSNGYHLITLPLLISTSIIGIASFFNNSIKNRSFIILLSIPLLFILGDNCWTVVSVLGQKTAFIYIFIILGFYFIKNNNILLGGILFSILPLFSITILPGVIGSLLVFISFFLVFKRSQYIKDITVLTTFLIFNILFLVLFYSTFKSDLSVGYLNNTLSNTLFKGIINQSIFVKCKIVLTNFICYILPTSFLHFKLYTSYYFIFFLILFRSILKNKALLAFIICLLIIGSITKTVTRDILDSSQFIDILCLFVDVFIVILISESLKNKSIFNYIFVLIVYIVIFNSIPTTLSFNENCKAPDDIIFTHKAAKLLDNDTSIVMVFQNKKTLYDKLHTRTFHMWMNRVDIYSITQFTNKTVIFTLGNPEFFLPEGNISFEDSLNYYYFTPLIYWKRKSKENTLQSFIDFYTIKNFYFQSGVEIPSFIINNSKNILKSQKTQSTFITCN